MFYSGQPLQWIVEHEQVESLVAEPDAIFKIMSTPLGVIAYVYHPIPLCSESFSMRVSQSRAVAVKDHLVTEGMASSRITVSGKGGGFTYLWKCY